MQSALPAAAATLMLAASAVVAEPVTLDTKPQTISMFKNGLAMVTTQADIPDAGHYQFPAPKARYGSLWLGWTEGLTLKNILATEVERSESTDAMSVQDLLRANVGSSFSIRLNDEWIAGTLLSMPTPPVPTPHVQPVSHRGYYPHPNPHPSPNLMLFETESGTLALTPSHITQVRFDDGQADTTFEKVITDTALSFSATESEGLDAAVMMRYLAHGISWSPSYAVEMIDDETARLACKAVIVNDLMDLDDVDVELIAGYPHLKFASSPTAMGPTTLTNLLASLQEGNQTFHAMASNSMVMQQRAGYAGRGFSAPTVSIPENVAGEAAEDLYFYQVPDVTLAKGERGYFPLISAEVPGSHVYTWDIPDFIDRNDRYSQQPDERQEVVWHSLELTNTTDQPWTTASAMTLKDGRPLGQDMLTFTPPGGSSLLKITQAVSIGAEQNEVEVERIRNAAKFHGNTYDQVTVEGTLRVTNFKDKPVKIKINKLVSGEVVETAPDSDVVKIASGLTRVNPRSSLSWEIEAEPGKDNAVTITYLYRFYTR